MKKSILSLLLLLICSIGVSQEANQTVKDSVASEPKLAASIDIVCPYFWRGLRYTGNKVAFQPRVNYKFTDKLNFEFWGTTNFSDASDAYNEFDWTISYQISPVVNVALADYYWPATSENPDWEKSTYFDYSFGSAQTLDFSVLLDFSEQGFPVSFQWSTFIGGNDYKIDSDGDATKRAFSSYAGVGYSHTLEKPKLELQCYLGAVIINGGYYSNDTDKSPGFQFTNLELGATRKITISKNYSIPLFVKYIYNNYGLQVFDNEGNLTKTAHNFFSFGLTFALK